MDDLLVVGPEFDTICEVWISLPHENQINMLCTFSSDVIRMTHASNIWVKSFQGTLECKNQCRSRDSQKESTFVCLEHIDIVWVT